MTSGPAGVPEDHAGRERRERDGELEGGAVLADVRGGEVDGDPLAGRSKPLFFRAEMTRTLLSFAAPSGKPTTWK